MKSILKFSNKRFGEVRIFDKNGEPWFIARDIAKTLGYSATEKMTRMLDADEKSNVPIWDTRTSQNRISTIISESGLYSVTINSQKKEAKEFRKWITSEVIPSIRKHGFYGTEEFVERAILDPGGMIEILKRYKIERFKRVIAEGQRDDAIRTKSQIGSKREATAMAKAANLSILNRCLTERLKKYEYRTVADIDWLDTFFDTSNPYLNLQIGKMLAVISVDKGIPVSTIKNSKYPRGINAYHVDVIEELEIMLFGDDCLLSIYNK